MLLLYLKGNTQNLMFYTCYHYIQFILIEISFLASFFLLLLENGYTKCII